MSDLQVQFVSSFDLASDYRVTIGGDRVGILVRVGCSPTITRAEYLPTILAQVGCVRYGRHPGYRAFPPAEVVAWFSDYLEIPLVGCRFGSSHKQIEYDGDPPPKPVRSGGSTSDWLNPDWKEWTDRVWRSQVPDPEPAG